MTQNDASVTAEGIRHGARHHHRQWRGSDVGAGGSGTASDTTILSGGEQKVGSTPFNAGIGIATATTVGGGGSQYVFVSGTAISTTILQRRHRDGVVRGSARGVTLRTAPSSSTTER